MLKIWGRLSSINVRKVVWCVQELDLAHARTEAGGPFGVMDFALTPGYELAGLARNSSRICALLMTKLYSLLTMQRL